MKKLFILAAFMCSLLCQAQTQLTTNSSCDSNSDGNVNIEDVANTANKVLGRSVAEKNVVTAEQLNAVLGEINAKLEKLSTIESRLSAIETKLGIETPSTDPSTGPTTDDLNGHAYVDLGLSVKWATMNIGATEVAGTKTNSHTGQLDCYGEYYAWGETSPKDIYEWANLKYCSSYDINNWKFTFTKYVASSTYGTVDTNRKLELTQNCDDAARVNWGGTWRMPTKTEQQELLNNCYWEWTSNYQNTDVAGYIVYKVKSSSDKGVMKYSGSSTTTVGSYSTSDAHIFLPAAGYRDVRYFIGVGSDAGFWSSSLYESNSSNASYINLTSSRVVEDNDFRYDGRSVRAVCP